MAHDCVMPPPDLSIRVDVFHHGVPGSDSEHDVLKSIKELKELIMVSNAELLTQINDLKTEVGDIGTQLSKAQGEITGKIAALEQAVNNQGNVSPEVVAAFADLKSSVDGLKPAAQALDDIVSDTPTP